MDFKSNAKLGDIYFIGEGSSRAPVLRHVLLNGVGRHSICMASGQPFGKNVITPESLGLPIEFARPWPGCG